MSFAQSRSKFHHIFSNHTCSSHPFHHNFPSISFLFGVTFGFPRFFPPSHLQTKVIEMPKKDSTSTDKGASFGGEAQKGKDESKPPVVTGHTDMESPVRMCVYFLLKVETHR